MCWKTNAKTQLCYCWKIYSFTPFLASKVWGTCRAEGTACQCSITPQPSVQMGFVTDFISVVTQIHRFTRKPDIHVKIVFQYFTCRTVGRQHQDSTVCASSSSYSWRKSFLLMLISWHTGINLRLTSALCLVHSLVPVTSIVSVIILLNITNCR